MNDILNNNNIYIYVPTHVVVGTLTISTGVFFREEHVSFMPSIKLGE